MSVKMLTLSFLAATVKKESMWLGAESVTRSDCFWIQARTGLVGEGWGGRSS